METREVRERFILLRAQGWSFERLAKELGKAKQTLVNWSKQYEEEIANLKAVELESLNERFFLSKQAKIQAFGEVLERIRREIKVRDLSDVPTDKLMDLFLKFYVLLETERVEPRFKTSTEITDSKKDKAALDRLIGIEPLPVSEREMELKVG